MKSMTLDQLRIFVAVAERAHLTRAAEALALTPSAVSAAIQALETRHGVRLFDRIGRRIEMNETGRLFLNEAKATLASARTAEMALEDLAGLRRGTLTIEASQTIASYWLPPHLVRFKAMYPGIEIVLREGNTRAVTQAVLEGLADVGFVEGAIDAPALALTTVATDRLVIVAAPDHPLVRKPQVTPADLLETRWILRERGSGTRAVFEANLVSRGIDPASLHGTLALPTNEAVCAAAGACHDLTVVSEIVARPHVEAGRLRAIAFQLDIRPFGMIRHKERYQTKAALAFEALPALRAGRS